MHFKRIVKSIKYFTLSLAILLLLLIFAVNLPYSQRIITSEANSFFQTKHFPVHVGKIALLMNGKLSLEQVIIRNEKLDTVIYSNQIKVAIRPLALLFRKVIVKSIRIENAVVNLAMDELTGKLNLLTVFPTGNKPKAVKNKKDKKWDFSLQTIHIENINFTYNDTIKGIQIAEKIGKLSVSVNEFNLANRKIIVSNLELKNAKGGIRICSPLKENPKKISTAQGWTISLQESSLQNISFTLYQPEIKQHIDVSLKQGDISKVEVDLNSNKVSVAVLQLEEPNLNLYSSPIVSKQNANQSNSELSSFLSKWNISGGKIKFENGSFHSNSYDTLMPAKISLAFLQTLNALNLTVKNIKLNEQEAAFDISRLSFVSGNGVQLHKGNIEFSSSAGQKSSLNINLKTNYSQLAMEIEVKDNLSAIIEKSFRSIPFALKINSAEFSSLDLFAFFPELKNKFPLPFEKDYRLGLSASIMGSTDSLQIENFELSTPENISVYTKGYLTQLTNLRSANCDINIHVGTIVHSRLQGLLQLAGFGIKLPVFDPLLVKGSIHKTVINPDFSLSILGKSGNIGIDGSIDVENKKYAIDAFFSKLKIGELIVSKDLGDFSGKLKLQGSGFRIDSLKANAMITIDTLGYKSYNYSKIDLGLTADNGSYSFDIHSADTAFKCNLTGYLYHRDSTDQGKISGSFDIQAGKLNLYKDSVRLAGEIAGHFFRSADSAEAFIDIHQLNLQKENKSANLKEASFSIQLSDCSLTAKIETDFLKGIFESHASINQLKEALLISKVRGITMLDSAINLNLPLITAMPELDISIESVYDPVIDLFLPDSVFSFHHVKFHLSKEYATTLAKGELFIDECKFKKFSGFGASLLLESMPNETKLDVKADSISVGIVSFGETTVDINIAEGIASFGLKINDRKDSLLYGLAAELIKRESRIELHSTLPQWVLNGNEWAVSPPEILSLEPLTGDFTANVHLKNKQSNIDFYGNKSSILNLDLKGVWISMLVNPDVLKNNFDGELNGRIEYSEPDWKKLIIQLDINQLKWSEEPIGKINIAGNLLFDTLGTLKTVLHVRMNDTTSIDLTANLGKKRQGNALQAHFNKIPIPVFENFVGKYLSGLKGHINGNMTMTTAANKPQMVGKFEFYNTSFKIIPLNALFSLSNDAIFLENNQLLFKDFVVLDSLKKPLNVNGTIDLNNPKNIISNLQITTDNLQVMNTTEKESPTFNGTIYMNSKLNILGPIQNPSIKGNLALASGTVINYNYVENFAFSEIQKTIYFVDRTKNTIADEDKQNSIKKMSNTTNMEASIEIDRNSIFNFKISKGYDIDVQITGGGFLNYTLLPNNKVNLSGTYEIQQGNSTLKITGWPRKYFTISSGSYLQWDGQLDDPKLKIETTSKVKGSYLNPVDNKNREVDFIVYMKLSNRLSQLEIVFDVLSADQYIMSVLNTLSSDERMRQAINLLIFERIELPNMSSSSDYVTEQVNQFWESQINQFTKSTIKNVDISFGIDTYTGSTEGGASQEYTSFTYQVKKDVLQERGSVMVSGRMNDNSAAGEQTNNMIENFTFEYALDSIRSKYLKVYRQQDYEDILEGEVTKSGVGYIYRKNYDKLSDIWKKKNNSTKGETPSVIKK